MKNIQNNNGKNKKKKSSDPWARSGERPGRGHGSELFVFLVFPWFFGLCVDSPDLAHGSELFVFFCVLEVLAKLQKTMEKPKNQKNKKTRNQKTKKPKKTKKTRLHTPRGGGQMQSVGSCLFFFFVFLVWIAIADVPSRDCQALSVVALEARSIHYSTAMFAMT